jgi:two-component system LytT family response regulator
MQAVDKYRLNPMGLNQATAVFADPMVTPNTASRLRNARRKARILVVDADPIRCERLRDTNFQDDNFEIIADCFNGLEVLEAVRRHSPDVILLDVNVPHLRSLRKLKSMAARPAIIFVIEQGRLWCSHAAKGPHFDRSLGTDGMRAALTQLDFSSVRANIGLQYKILDQLTKNSRDGSTQRLAFKTGDGITVMETQDIEWIESDGDYIYVHTRSGLQRVRGAFPAVLDKLNCSQFFRVSSRILINVFCLRELKIVPGKPPSVVLDGNKSFPVMRRYINDLKKMIDALWAV